MYYQFYEWNHAILSPARVINDAIRLYYKNPLNPFAHTEMGRQIAAAGDVFERLTRRYRKPEFGLDTTEVDGRTVDVTEEVVWERPFCRVLHFKRDLPPGTPKQSNVLLVAPMSGHYATLLRGTVQALLPHHEVYITDWVDARMVPIAYGNFDLDDYIDYVIDFTQFMKGDIHIVAVCQPAVPVFAATALMEAGGSPVQPKSITLMGGPIDTRENPTEVNTYAAKHDLDWFRRNVVMSVPMPYPGMMRQVYPGFLQLTGFMTMNLDRHVSAHYDYFDHLVKGDGDSAEKHRDFYDEYLSVMDLTAEFYLQTVDTVFLRHLLPKGEMMHRDWHVDPSRIRQTPIFTIEGEKDDISGLGQTKAAHRLTPNLPAEKHAHYMQEGVGHYGVFNGSRFRQEIAPRITDFINRWDDPSGVTATAQDTFSAAGEAAATAAKAMESAAASVSSVTNILPVEAEAKADGAAPDERKTIGMIEEALAPETEADRPADDKPRAERKAIAEAPEDDDVENPLPKASPVRKPRSPRRRVVKSTPPSTTRH
ncbi:polyhydroxyalkanoate depolymerase [Acuticoccus sp. M5D2P5]|uniref:polyhydroxyalkanoate depolymerase n=1 Tax=Acuticoccus kalidii TaxID=2910977 RepID=UPI001F1A4075|nr:polyhydroxyalkanoate depolymerase [Acuticoccus kalidii]MCF3932350.1 polyhydroxyalkanoate depolymerase [Acuticoccus kalidii]